MTFSHVLCLFACLGSLSALQELSPCEEQQKDIVRYSESSLLTIRETLVTGIERNVPIYIMFCDSQPRVWAEADGRVSVTYGFMSLLVHSDDRINSLMTFHRVSVWENFIKLAVIDSLLGAQKHHLEVLRQAFADDALNGHLLLAEASESLFLRHSLSIPRCALSEKPDVASPYDCIRAEGAIAPDDVKETDFAASRDDPSTKAIAERPVPRKCPCERCVIV